MDRQKVLEKSFETLFFFCASLSILAIGVISFFIFANAIPFIAQYGLDHFLFGQVWAPSNIPASYGIFPMVIGSLVITLGAILMGVPIGILTALFLVYFCPKKLYRVLKPAVSLMAAIPSIVYGFFGLQLMVPWIRTWGGNGMSVLTASLLLAIMILPTIITMSESSLRAVPAAYYPASIALGASHERSVMRVMLPAARSGIFSAVILGIGRAIGETMAVILVAGNQPILPTGLLSGTRTMTTNIVLEMAYASGEHREALIATSAVLFLFILVINTAFILVKRRAI